MAQSEVQRLTEQWRKDVMTSLGNLDHKLDETADKLNEKLDSARREIVDLKMQSVTQTEIDILEKRVDALEEFKTKAWQTFLVLQVVTIAIWALVTSFFPFHK